jgi:hypothetical protein
VLDRVEAEADDPASALLGVTVIDPACGSGHFLLAAGRRIATRLASARAGGVASAEDFRHALRDVARSCIYGVDRNPMAVELTKHRSGARVSEGPGLAGLRYDTKGRSMSIKLTDTQLVSGLSLG